MVGQSRGKPHFALKALVAAIFGQRETLLIVTLMLAAVVSLQWSSHAYFSELGAHRDEPAHYVTGLLVQDYITQHATISPLQFTKQFYAHYPKVALGHWPPFFYLLQAAWSLLFSSSVASVLVLVGLISALCGSLLGFLVMRSQTLAAGLMAGLLFVANPVVARVTCEVMADGLLALLMLAATLAFVLYLNAEQYAARYSLLFGLLTTLAFLTKGSAIALVFVPAVVLSMTNKWDVLKKSSFWLAPVLVLLLCGPWYWLARNMAAGTWTHPSPRFVYTAHALHFYFYALRIAIGPMGLALAAIGLLHSLSIQRRPAEPHTTSAIGLFALLAGVAAVALIVPVGLEPRFIIPALPPLVFFAADGASWVAGRVGQYLPRLQPYRTAVCVILLGLALFFSFNTIHKEYAGLGDVADAILGSSSPDYPSVLIASDANGEGMFVSDMASRRRESDSVVIRGTKILSDSNWQGTDYRSFDTTPHEIVDRLDALPVAYVVTDHSIAPLEIFPHQKILDQAIVEYPAFFAPLGTFDAIRDGVRHPASLQLYRFVHSAPPSRVLRLPMSRMLRSEVEIVVPESRR